MMAPEIRKTYIMLCYRDPGVWKETISPVDAAKDYIKMTLMMGRLNPDERGCLEILNKYHIE